MDCSKNVGENWVRFFQAPATNNPQETTMNGWRFPRPSSWTLLFTEHITAVPTNEIWGILPKEMAISIVKLILHMDFNRVFLQQFQVPKLLAEVLLTMVQK
jgi:hypothetical protein